MPGERGLLAVSDVARGRRRRFDEEAEAVVGRAIAAVTALRRYRDEAGVKPAAVRARAARRRRATRSSPASVARLARFELAGQRRTSRSPRSACRAARSSCCRGGFDPAEAAASGSRPGARSSRRRSRALEGSSPTSGFVEKAPPEVVEGEREKLESYRAELERLGT